MLGISLTHGGHQLPQKLRKTTFPLKSAKLVFGCPLNLWSSMAIFSSIKLNSLSGFSVLGPCSVFSFIFSLNQLPDGIENANTKKIKINKLTRHLLSIFILIVL